VRFARQHHILYAAAISYYGLISLVPLLALIISVFSLFLQSNEAQAAAHKALAATFPSIPMESIVNAVDIVSSISSWAIIIYLLGLIWAGAYFFESIERVINAIWSGTSTRTFYIRKIIGMVIVVICGLLLFATTILSTVWTTVIQVTKTYEVEWLQISGLIEQLTTLIPLVIIIIMLTIIYKSLPARRIPWRAAFAGGLFCGVFWELFKRIFSLFAVSNNSAYNAFYGSLASVIILMLWIHISAIILILGAHIGCIVQERMDGVYKPYQGDD